MYYIFLYIILYTTHICYMRYSWLLRRLKWKNVSPLWRRHHFSIIRCIYWNMRPTTISFDTFGPEYSLLQDVNTISILIDSLFAFDRSILNMLYARYFDISIIYPYLSNAKLHSTAYQIYILFWFLFYWAAYHFRSINNMKSLKLKVCKKPNRQNLRKNLLTTSQNTFHCHPYTLHVS